MYYYRGEKIGTYEQAFVKILGNSGMRLDLIETRLSTYTDEELMDLIIGHLDRIYTLSYDALIDDILRDMMEVWNNKYFKEPGEFYGMGDFAFEDWEGLE